MLNDGKIVEFDSAKVLLSNDNSYFSELVRQTGSIEAEYLRTVANSNRFETKLEETVNVLDEERIQEAMETDPLVSS